MFDPCPWLASGSCAPGEVKFIAQLHKRFKWEMLWTFQRVHKALWHFFNVSCKSASWNNDDFADMSCAYSALLIFYLSGTVRDLVLFAIFFFCRSDLNKPFRLHRRKEGSKIWMLMMWQWCLRRHEWCTSPSLCCSIHHESVIVVYVCVVSPFTPQRQAHSLGLWSFDVCIHV